MSYQNAALTKQESTWIDEVAGRLRLIQADAAVAGPQQRREFLNEELARSFKKAAPTDRRRYLEALFTRFPVGGQLLNKAVPAKVPTPTPLAAETFDQLLECLIKAAAELDEKKRVQTAKRLSEAGLALTENEALVLEISEQLQKGLGLPTGEQPKLQNIVKLSVLLVENLQRLDQAALATMRELAPRSSLLKRPQDLKATVVAFLTGQGDAIEPHLRVVSGLLGALLAAMLGGGRDFGRHFVERLSPTSIEDVVVGEGGGSSLFGKSKKERCWERYVLLSKDFETADLVERRLRDCLVAFVERRVMNAR
jgi:hypothetical protein